MLCCFAFLSFVCFFFPVLFCAVLFCFVCFVFSVLFCAVLLCVVAGGGVVVVGVVVSVVFGGGGGGGGVGGGGAAATAAAVVFILLYNHYVNGTQVPSTVLVVERKRSFEGAANGRRVDHPKELQWFGCKPYDPGASFKIFGAEIVQKRCIGAGQQQGRMVTAGVC